MPQASFLSKFSNQPSGLYGLVRIREHLCGSRPVILKSTHDLGMDVVAEGAKTDSDAVELDQLGCEYAQGFAFGEPMDADAAMRMLTEERLEAAS
jgi:predicted signal transduction protein with EAL and GGDEF domain